MNETLKGIHQDRDSGWNCMKCPFSGYKRVTHMIKSPKPMSLCLLSRGLHNSIVPTSPQWFQYTCPSSWTMRACKTWWSPECCSFSFSLCRDPASKTPPSNWNCIIFQRKEAKSKTNHTMTVFSYFQQISYNPYLLLEQQLLQTVCWKCDLFRRWGGAEMLNSKATSR